MEDFLLPKTTDFWHCGLEFGWKINFQKGRLKEDIFVVDLLEANFQVLYKSCVQLTSAIFLSRHCSQSPNVALETMVYCQRCYGRGKTGNLVLDFSRQEKARKAPKSIHNIFMWRRQHKTRENWSWVVAVCCYNLLAFATNFESGDMPTMGNNGLTLFNWTPLYSFFTPW